jgi:hypothetical protein
LLELLPDLVMNVITKSANPLGKVVLFSMFATSSDSKLMRLGYGQCLGTLGCRSGGFADVRPNV